MTHRTSVCRVHTFLLALTTLCSLWLCGESVLLAAAPQPTTHKPDHLVIVCHPENPVISLSMRELRKIFRAERKHWPDGEAITLVVREAYSPERSLFLEEVYEMDETKYRRFWLEKVFRGEADRPLTAMSPESVRTIVGRRKSAIGYLKESDVDNTVKVVKINGDRAIGKLNEVPAATESTEKE